MSQSDLPLVSIVTPTYNMAGRLPFCLASIRAQTYAAIEHIVVDGGSADGTVDLLARTEGVRWVSEPDGGQADAINKGLRMASGVILGWLNADDELVPTAIEQIVATFQSDPEIGLVYGDIEQIVDGVSIRVAPAPRLSVDVLWRGNHISQPGTFWTRTAQDTVGVLDDSYRLTMDFEYWLRFAHAGIKATYLPEVLARFVVHDESKTGSAGGLAFAREEARALRKHGEEHGAAMVIDRWYWEDVVRRVGESATNGDRREAAMLAQAALPRMHSLRSRTRWFLWLARYSPRAAAVLYRPRLNRPSTRPR